MLGITTSVFLLLPAARGALVGVFMGNGNTEEFECVREARQHDGRAGRSPNAARPCND